jgi:hypothetical protein
MTASKNSRSADKNEKKPYEAGTPDEILKNAEYRKAVARFLP